MEITTEEYRVLFNAWDKCAKPVNPDALIGRECYGGLDLSSSTDITAFVLVFPPREENEPCNHVSSGLLLDIYHMFWTPWQTRQLLRVFSIITSLLKTNYTAPV